MFSVRQGFLRSARAIYGPRLWAVTAIMGCGMMSGLSACNNAEEGAGGTDDCAEGQEEIHPCPDGADEVRICVDGTWMVQEACPTTEEPASCEDVVDGEIYTTCGYNDRGVRTHQCKNGEVVSVGGCDDPDECTAESIQEKQKCPDGKFASHTKSCVLEDENDPDSPYVWSASDCEVTSLDISASNGCVITHDKRVACWGDNSVGQLGRGNTNSEYGVLGANPVIFYDNSRLEDVKKVAVGMDFACALTELQDTGGGDVYCWGKREATSHATDKSVATLVEGLDGRALDISTGNSHACAIVETEDGNGVQCWGTNGDSQLGNNSTTASRTPVRVVLPADLVPETLQLAYHQSCVIGAADAPFAPRPIACWGLNKRLTAGLPNEGNRVWEPTELPVRGLGEQPLALTSRNLCVVTADPIGSVVQQYVKLACIGEGTAAHPDSDGATDHDEYYASVHFESDFSPGDPDYPTPVRLGGSGDTGSPAPTTMCAIDRADMDLRTQLWCWGANASGALGRGYAGTDEGTLGELAMPQAVQLLSEDTEYLEDVQAFATSPYSVCALTGAGKLYCSGAWGAPDGRMLQKH